MALHNIVCGNGPRRLHVPRDRVRGLRPPAGFHVYSVRNSFTGFVRTACHTLIPEVIPAIKNKTITE